MGEWPEFEDLSKREQHRIKCVQLILEGLAEKPLEDQRLALRFTQPGFGARSTQQPDQPMLFIGLDDHPIDLDSYRPSPHVVEDPSTGFDLNGDYHCHREL